MKTPTSLRTRKSAAINNSCWLAYATASATSAVVAAHSTQGAIHYSGPINEWIGGYHHFYFPLDQEGDSIGFKHHQIWSGGYGGTARFGVAGLAGAAFAGFYHSCSGNPQAFVSNLDRGQLISNQPFLARQSGFIAAGWWLSCYDYVGQFPSTEVGYIGFKFNNGTGDQYGWARIRNGGRRPYDHVVKLIDYAYGDVGDRVRVGQKSTNEMVSEKGSLGLLALGAVGLLAWRKGRKKGNLL